MFILLGLVNNLIVIYNPKQFEAERQSRVLSFHTEPALANLIVFSKFKVYYFPILLVKALFILFPSTKSSYTFAFGPSDIGVRLIDEES